jgi:hypothetical protein
MHQPHLRFEHNDAGAFTAYQGSSNIKRRARQQLIEIVTGDPARDLRKPLANQVPIPISQLHQLRIDPPPTPILVNDLIQLSD